MTHTCVVDPGSCSKCTLSKRQPHTKIVPGLGNPNADIMIINDSPDKTDSYLGQPLSVGNPARKILEELLNYANIDINNTFRTNICKCWAWEWKQAKNGINSLINRQPDSKEIKQCLKYLRTEIEMVKPKVIITLGSLALSILDGKKHKITEKAGVPHIYKQGSLYSTNNNIYIIPVYHPSFIQHNGGIKMKNGNFSVVATEFITHLNKSHDIISKKALFQKHDYKTIENKQELLKMCEEIKTRQVCTFDIETTGLDFQDKILGVGYGLDVGKARYVPFLTRPFFGDGLEDYWADKDVSRQEVCEILKTVQDNVTIQKAAHNAKFDMRGMQKDLSIYTKGLFWDTMCGSYLINENSSNALDDLKNDYIDLLGYSEAFGKESSGGKKAYLASLPTISKYCCGDCDATYRLVKDQIQLFETLPNYKKLMQKYYIPMMEFIKDFEYNGVLYNVEKATSMRNDYADKAEKMLKKIIDTVGVPFNPGSTPELAKVLFNVLGLPQKEKTDTGLPKTDKAVLEELAKIHVVPKMILDLRHFNKMRSTYLERFINIADSNNRIHLATKPIGTKTGRPSSEGLMNIPSAVEIKSLFMARPGYKLVCADLSQAEVRCFAHYANEQVLRDAFAQDGIDVHCMVAAEIAQVPYEDFVYGHKNGNSSYSTLRQGAKATVFGLLYGRGAPSIAREQGIDVKAAIEFMDRFFQKFPKCKKWIDDTHALVHETGEVENIFGRVRHLPTIFSSDTNIMAKAERQSVNSIIQSTASDITCLAMMNIHAQLAEERLPANIVLTVYDSIICEVRDDYVPYVSKLLVDHMERPCMESFSVKMKADVDIYQRWGESL